MSVVTRSNVREVNDAPQVPYNANVALSRKFSHINKLAQRLAIHNEEEIPFNLLKKGSLSSRAKMGTIKFKRVRSINKSNIALKDPQIQLEEK